MTASKKLPKEKRRKQLLDTALGIIRSEGTDALTLSVLAERAGVSKPVAYEHFRSRAGLLIMLYKQIDQQQVDIALKALERAPHMLEDAARVLSDAYMKCYNHDGPEWHAISAALRGAGDMEAIRQELMDGYARIYSSAFAPYSNLPEQELHVYCVGIIGAAEAIFREMLRDRISESAASDALKMLIIRYLSTGGKGYSPGANIGDKVIDGSWRVVEDEE